MHVLWYLDVAEQKDIQETNVTEIVTGQINTPDIPSLVVENAQITQEPITSNEQDPGREMKAMLAGEQIVPSNEPSDFIEGKCDIPVEDEITAPEPLVQTSSCEQEADIEDKVPVMSEECVEEPGHEAEMIDTEIPQDNEESARESTEVSVLNEEPLSCKESSLVPESITDDIDEEVTESKEESPPLETVTEKHEPAMPQEEGPQFDQESTESPQHCISSENSEIKATESEGSEVAEKMIEDDSHIVSPEERKINQEETISTEEVCREDEEKLSAMLPIQSENVKPDEEPNLMAVQDSEIGREMLSAPEQLVSPTEPSGPQNASEILPEIDHTGQESTVERNYDSCFSQTAAQVETKTAVNVSRPTSPVKQIDKLASVNAESSQVDRSLENTDAAKLSDSTENQTAEVQLSPARTGRVSPLNVCKAERKTAVNQKGLTDDINIDVQLEQTPENVAETQDESTVTKEPQFVTKEWARESTAKKETSTKDTTSVDRTREPSNACEIVESPSPQGTSPLKKGRYVEYLLCSLLYL